MHYSIYVKSLRTPNCSRRRPAFPCRWVKGTRGVTTGRYKGAQAPKTPLHRTPLLPSQPGGTVAHRWHGPDTRALVTRVTGCSSATREGASTLGGLPSRACTPCPGRAGPGGFPLSLSLVPLPCWALLGHGSSDVSQVREGVFLSAWGTQQGEGCTAERGGFLAQRSQLEAGLSQLTLQSGQMPSRAWLLCRAGARATAGGTGAASCAGGLSASQSRTDSIRRPAVGDAKLDLISGTQASDYAKTRVDHQAWDQQCYRQISGGQGRDPVCRCPAGPSFWPSKSSPRPWAWPPVL